jgi:hypothetical protein
MTQYLISFENGAMEPASSVIPYAEKIQIPGNAWNVGVAPS